jgi:hypothetical protein
LTTATRGDYFDGNGRGTYRFTIDFGCSSGDGVGSRIVGHEHIGHGGGGTGGLFTIDNRNAGTTTGGGTEEDIESLEFRQLDGGYILRVGGVSQLKPFSYNYRGGSIYP